MQSQPERKTEQQGEEISDEKKKNRDDEEISDEKKKNNDDEIPLISLNHVSRVCKDVKKSVEFYTKLLGFVLIERPQAFDFDGAWLFNYGVGIHLVHAKDDEQHKLPNDDADNLDPMDNHISFQV